MRTVSYPFPTNPAVSKRMRANKKRDTSPELKVRSALHRRGFRFRVNSAIRAGAVKTRGDIVFAPIRLAVFVDGCFWHGCRIHGTDPQRNRAYWSAKLQRNRQRDGLVNSSLRQAGWIVLRYWEHSDPENVADEIAAVIRDRRRQIAER
jgi:DNA mismatch endonuclease (patch repair protein)